MEFSHELALALVRSEERFPVDFDDAWKWIGWPKKQHGKEVLLNNFDEGADFLRKGVKSPSFGRPSEHIVLTIDCFKSLGMMAGTQKGKEVRRHFLECERQLRQIQEHLPELTDLPDEPPAPLSTDRVMRRLELEQRVRVAYTRMQHNQRRLCLALSHLRQEQLWRDITDPRGKSVYSTFDEYCKHFLGISKSEAHNKALAGDVLRTLHGIPEDWKPKSADALAALNQVPEDERERFLGQLADEAKAPTAFNIRQSIQEGEMPRAIIPASSISSAGKVAATVYLYPDLKERAEALARQRQMSFSSFIANLIYQEFRQAAATGEA